MKFTACHDYCNGIVGAEGTINMNTHSKIAHEIVRVVAETMPRIAELGEIVPDTMLPICPSPDRFGILVAGGPGTHSIYVPSVADTSRAVAREVVWAG